ncbi:MAG: di-trans,poly-cis-decaprenylcistransferase [Planctomycetes bacterium]|nr:di-trans,poly-cis-decaprenylcistransferase [Planctomycetota bacterium]
MDLQGVRHIAIIMDGNGRWAEARGMVRARGHRAGVDSVREVVTDCARAHLPWLTLYALSTENFKMRPALEVRLLMVLLKRFMINERATLMENGVRLITAGRIQEFPARVVAEIRRTEALTAGNRGMTLCLALNYGGRGEIVDAARELAREVRAGNLDPESIDEAAFAQRLYCPSMPDVDLLVRTAGDLRVSNFLLWQISYAEIFVTPMCWPDVRRPLIESALAEYARRDRRFGGVQGGGAAS